MACPFFHPAEPFADGAWLKPPRLPLGDACLGRCMAEPAGPVLPSLDELRQCCNLGYARGRCSRFPAASDAMDAIRFSIAGDGGDKVEVVYIYERDYAPVRHGRLLYDAAAACFRDPVESPVLEAQARRFVLGYLTRRIMP